VSGLDIDVDPAGRGHLWRLPSRELDIVGQDAEIEDLDLVPRVRREAGRWDDVVPHLPLAPVVADVLLRRRGERPLGGPEPAARRLDRQIEVVPVRTVAPVL